MKERVNNGNNATLDNWLERKVVPHCNTDCKTDFLSLSLDKEQSDRSATVLTRPTIRVKIDDSGLDRKHTAAKASKCDISFSNYDSGMTSGQRILLEHDRRKRFKLPSV